MTCFLTNVHRILWWRRVGWHSSDQLIQNIMTWCSVFVFNLLFIFVSVGCGVFALALRFGSFCAQALLPPDTWDLISRTRNQTHAPCIGRQILKHWATREVPLMQCFKICVPFNSSAIRYSKGGKKRISCRNNLHKSLEMHFSVLKALRRSAFKTFDHYYVLQTYLTVVNWKKCTA